jgi:hypothetical protein
MWTDTNSAAAFRNLPEQMGGKLEYIFSAAEEAKFFAYMSRLMYAKDPQFTRAEISSFPHRP